MTCAMRTIKCSDCPEMITGRFSPSKDYQCINCAIKRMESAATQMANKSGPAYDKWLESRGPRGRPLQYPTGE